MIVTKSPRINRFVDFDSQVDAEEGAITYLVWFGCFMVVLLIAGRS